MQSLNAKMEPGSAVTQVLLWKTSERLPMAHPEYDIAHAFHPFSKGGGAPVCGDSARTFEGL